MVLGRLCGGSRRVPHPHAASGVPPHGRHPRVHARRRPRTAPSAAASPSPALSPAAAVAGSAGSAAAADDDLSAYLPARFKGADKLLSRQDRHLVSRFSYGVTPGPRPRRAQGRRRPQLVRAAAEAELGQGQEGRPAPGVVAQPQARPQGAVGAPDHRRRGRLGGHEQLRPLVDDAPDGVEAAGLRGHGRVLGEPPARPRARRRPVHPPGRLRQPDPRARPGPVRRDAARHDDPPRDADLPRRGRVDQGAPQREPRPGAARAAHGRRGQLRREGRQGLGPDPDRLVGRHVGDLATRVPRGRPLPRHRQGQGLQGQEPQGQRQEADRRLPALPGAPPGHRRAPRRQAVREVHRRQGQQVARQEAGEGLPRQRHGDRPGAAGAGRLRPVPALDRRQGPRPGGGPGGDVPRAPHRRAAAARRRGHLQRVRHRGDDLAGRRHRAGAVQLGEPGRRSRSTTSRGPHRAG